MALTHAFLLTVTFASSLSPDLQSTLAVSCSVVPASLRPHGRPLSVGFSRQEYWSGLPFPSPEHIGVLFYFPRMCSMLLL